MARPREFDIDEALDRAMEAFWRHGYEATSMTDLMKVMGLQKGSIYKAWEDKHALFMAVLERYMNGVFENLKQGVSQAPTPLEGIRGWLTQAREWGAEGSLRKGCMGINSMAELAPHDQEVRALMQRHFKKVEAFLTDIISRGQKEGQFRSDVPAQRMAHYLSVFAAGTVVTTKGSFPGLEKDDITDVALLALIAG